MAARDCPCFSGARYAACCEPAHERRNAPTAEALMRSRYSAYALGLVDYLMFTLSREHEDRAVPHATLARSLARAKDEQRFLGLRVLFAGEDEVLFFAKIYSRGVDRSFMELSDFVLEDDGWKYSGGVLVPRERLPADFETLDKERFLAIA